MQSTDTQEALDPSEVIAKLKTIAGRWAEERGERQRRRELVKEDFDELCETGYLLCAVPAERGGLWRDAQHSTRPICEMLRTLAHGDASVALVASMHPAVILSGGWLTAPDAPEPYTEARRGCTENPRARDPNRSAAASARVHPSVVLRSRIAPSFPARP